MSAIAFSLIVAVAGCSKASSDVVVSAEPLKPKQAASQLQQAFQSDAQLAQEAKVASEALRTADYEKAVQSLATIRARPNITFEQGVAVHNSMVSLEANLIRAMEGGDPNAKRAYEQLKKSRRN